MKYAELTKEEKSVARVMFLNALNEMESEQAIDAGKIPKPYKMSSPLFKDMLPESEYERYVDADGANRLRLILA